MIIETQTKNKPIPNPQWNSPLSAMVKNTSIFSKTDEITFLFIYNSLSYTDNKVNIIVNTIQYCLLIIIEQSKYNPSKTRSYGF